jgi:predicted ATPase
MKITRVYLKNFKRFTELEIKEIPPEAKLIVLAGPNGCGKSSVFDGFEQIGGVKKGNLQREDEYLRKDPGQPWHAEFTDKDGQTYSFQSNNQPETLTYIRSPYRYTSHISVSQLQALPKESVDHDRPKTMIDIDSRLTTNYQRLFTASISDLFSGALDSMTGKDIREKYTGTINGMLSKILDIQISDIGEPLSGRGQLFFSKGKVSKFPYSNLSSGEKEVIDLIIDLVLKIRVFDDTIFCIDEPDLHLNTSIQGKLLEEILNLIPDNSQLWIATHSLGFIRKAVEIYRKSSGKDAVILDFSETDFDQKAEIKPLVPTATVMRKLFMVALEDLSSMIIPSNIYFCEGKSRYDTSQQSTQRTEFDAEVLNKIFYDQDVIFVSSGGKNGAQKANQLLLKIIKEAGGLREIYSITDRDNLSDEERNKKMSDEPTLKIWSRREIENYLFDEEIIKLYCEQNSKEFSTITAYSNIQDINKDDVKQYQSSIMQQCGFNGSIDEFKLKLAELITPQTLVYELLKRDLGL